MGSDLTRPYPECFDPYVNLSAVSPDSLPDRLVQTSFRHNSVASSSPRYRSSRSSPYGSTERGRRSSDGASLALNRAQRSTFLLNKIAGTATSALLRSNLDVADHEALTTCHSYSTSVSDPNAALRPSLRRHLTAPCTSTSEGSNRSSTPPNRDDRASESRSLMSPPFNRRLFSSFSSFSSHPINLFSDIMDPPSPPPGQPSTTTSSGIRHQSPRFPSDLYTPIYTRNNGPLREGWCGFCRPGRWLVLKNSAFWYDKCFGHGICAATGMRFEEPEEIRPMSGKGEDAVGWGGRCGTCGEWIMLAEGKRGGVPWFRHAYKVKA